jgi:hypothetical protein
MSNDIKCLGGIFMAIAAGEKMYASDILNLTFFPKGTILTFSTEAYNATSAEFKNIWKICNGTGSTPNLVNKFLRGAGSSGTTGGADSVQLAKENLPKHGHEIDDPGHTHNIGYYGQGSHSGSYSLQDNKISELHTNKDLTGISIKDTFPSQTEYARAFSIVPSYYTVIYIMKIA